MLFELIAVVVAGIAAAGVLALTRRVWSALPRWLIPFAAAAAMLAAAISLEYSWYGRTVASLPEGVDVALTHDVSAPWKPWTYLAPYTDRFLAVDRGGARTNPDIPGQTMVDIYAFGRWVPVRSRPAVVDCPGGRRADITARTGFDADGALTGAAWRQAGPDDPILLAVCAGV